MPKHKKSHHHRRRSSGSSGHKKTNKSRLEISASHGTSQASSRTTINSSRRGSNKTIESVKSIRNHPHDHDNGQKSTPNLNHGPTPVVISGPPKRDGSDPSAGLEGPGHKTGTKNAGDKKSHHHRRRSSGSSGHKKNHKSRLEIGASHGTSHASSRTIINSSRRGSNTSIQSVKSIRNHPHDHDNGQKSTPNLNPGPSPVVISGLPERSGSDPYAGLEGPGHQTGTKNAAIFFLIVFFISALIVGIGLGIMALKGTGNANRTTIPPFTFDGFPPCPADPYPPANSTVGLVGLHCRDCVKTNNTQQREKECSDDCCNLFYKNVTDTYNRDICLQLCLSALG